MFVSIRVQGQPAQDPLREHLDRRLRTAVQPFGARVAGIALRATTPATSGAATTCRVAVALRDGGRVVTGTGRGANAYFAADAALERAVRAARKTLGEGRGAEAGAAPDVSRAATGAPPSAAGEFPGAA